MPSYLSLLNWTEQGIADIKSGPERLEASKQAIEAAGGRMIFFYLTMGEYDAVALVELPNDEAAATLLLAIGGQGNVRSQTLRAFTRTSTGRSSPGFPSPRRSRRDVTSERWARRVRSRQRPRGSAAAARRCRHSSSGRSRTSDGCGMRTLAGDRGFEPRPTDPEFADEGVRPSSLIPPGGVPYLR